VRLTAAGSIAASRGAPCSNGASGRYSWPCIGSSEDGLPQPPTSSGPQGRWTGSRPPCRATRSGTEMRYCSVPRCSVVVRSGRCPQHASSAGDASLTGRVRSRGVRFGEQSRPIDDPYGPTLWTPQIERSSTHLLEDFHRRAAALPTRHGNQLGTVHFRLFFGCEKRPARPEDQPSRSSTRTHTVAWSAMRPPASARPLTATM
jgi:hypothetical protein